MVSARKALGFSDAAAALRREAGALQEVRRRFLFLRRWDRAPELLLFLPLPPPQRRALRSARRENIAAVAAADGQNKQTVGEAAKPLVQCQETRAVTAASIIRPPPAHCRGQRSKWQPEETMT